VRRGGLAVLAVSAILAVPWPVPARAQEALPDGAGPSLIDEHHQEVLGIARQLDRTDADLRRNRERGTRLARKVETLKKSPSGVMRDVQLQDALKDLRGAIAEERRLKGVGASLAIGLRTQRLELAREAGAVADRLMAEGENLVRGDDLEAARHRFEAAFDLLTMPVEVPREAPVMPAEKADPNVDVRPRGDETPDELRVLALILRDGADRAAYNAQLWSGLLSRLRAERRTVAALLDLAPPPSPTRADVLARLETRIGEVEGEITARRRTQGRLLAEAVFLERQAGLKELAMLRNAVAPSPQAAPEVPEGTP
jgi:hypothetical protein